MEGKDEGRGQKFRLVIRTSHHMVPTRCISFPKGRRGQHTKSRTVVAAAKMVGTMVASVEAASACMQHNLRTLTTPHI